MDAPGAHVLLMGHRRIRRTDVLDTPDGVRVHVATLKDNPYDQADDVIRATKMEIISTIKEMLQHNPMQKEQLHFFAQVEARLTF